MASKYDDSLSEMFQTTCLRSVKDVRGCKYESGNPHLYELLDYYRLPLNVPTGFSFKKFSCPGDHAEFMFCDILVQWSVDEFKKCDGRFIHLFHSLKRKPGSQDEQKRFGNLQCEIDFLMLHPKYGILMLEAKSKKIKVKKVKDQFERGKECLKKIVNSEPNMLSRCLKSNLFENRSICVAAFENDPVHTNHFVVITEEHVRDKDAFDLRMSEFFEDCNVLSKSDSVFMDNIAACVCNFLKIDSANRYTICGTVADKEFTDGKLYLKWTDEQMKAFQDWDKPEVVISGPAGSGKSEIIKEKIRRFSKDGRKSLFLCYNRAFMESVKKWFLENENDDVECYTFHSFAIDALRKVDIFDPAYTLEECCKKLKEGHRDYYAKFVLSPLSENYCRKNLYDNIFVDEAQDLFGEWKKFLKLFLTNSNQNGAFWIAYDCSQNIQHESDWNVNDEHNVIDVSLDRVVRNPRSVFTYFLSFYENNSTRQKGFQKFRPAKKHIYHCDDTLNFEDRSEYQESTELHSLTDDRHSLKTEVIKVVSAYGSSGRVLYEDMAVLIVDKYPKSRRNSLKQVLMKNKIPVCSAVERQEGNPGICVDSVLCFKGLECKVVLLPMTASIYEKTMKARIYTAMSRTCWRLHIFTKEKFISKVKSQREKRHSKYQKDCFRIGKKIFDKNEVNPQFDVSTSRKRAAQSRIKVSSEGARRGRTGSLLNPFSQNPSQRTSSALAKPGCSKTKVAILSPTGFLYEEDEDDE